MNKHLLISIRPEHVLNILNGKKTIELRKVVPNWVKKEIENGNTVKCLIYCTKGKNILLNVDDVDYETWEVKGKFYDIVSEKELSHGVYEYNKIDVLNGKIVAEFDLNKLDVYQYDENRIIPSGYENHDGDWLDTSENLGKGYWITFDELKKTCVQEKEMIEYGNGKNLYGLQIDNLKIIEPMELSSIFYNKGGKAVEEWLKNNEIKDYIQDNKAPQNMMEVWK